MKIIDCHTHPCFDNQEYKRIAERNGIDFSLPGLLQEMKENNVERAVAIPLHMSDNNSIANLSKENNKLLAVACADVPNLSEKFMKNLENELIQKKFIGIKLYPGYQHFYPNEKKCEIIYRLAEKYGIPVIFHSGDVLITSTTKQAKIKYAHPIYIDDVAVDHPDMKIVIAHAGNPWIIDAVEVAYKNENVFLDISGWFLGEINGPYGKIMKERLNYIIAYLESYDKILYGTDWPLIRMKSYIDFMKESGMKNSILRKMMYENASKLYCRM